MSQPTFGSENLEPCADLACDSGLVLEVPRNYAWPSGAYTFEFLLDGKAINCKGQLPLRSCDQSSISCNVNGVQIGESGCALNAKMHGWGDIRVDGFPKKIRVKIRQNQKVLFSQNTEPRYIEATPPCGQTESKCRQSHEVLELKAD
jgi:hypothetical protein